MTEQQILTIYRDTIDAFYGYVSRRCGGDRAMAEDVTQETWLRAIRSWQRMGVPDRPLPWLMTVARNLMLNERRRTPPVPLDAIRATEILGQATDSGSIDSAEIVQLVSNALARMPLRQRQLIEAFHFERSSVSRIAHALELSERAVEGRLRRARQNLRRELEAALTAAGGIE